MDLLCVERFGGVDNRKAEIDPVIFSDMRVLENLLSCEGYYIPKCNYFSQVQTDIKPFMRKAVALWMSEVCEEQHCEDQVFPLAINYLDRFLCSCVVNRNQLQLVGAVCILLAAKTKQCHPLSVELLCFYSDNSITPEQMRKWEIIVLTHLQWDLSAVTGYDYVDHVLERLPWSKEQPRVRTHAHTLVSLCYIEPDFVRISPALLASSSILAAARGLQVANGTAESVLKLTRCDAAAVEQIVEVIESLVSTHVPTLPTGKPPTPNTSVTPTTKLSSPQEDARQPETPTDVQEVHF